MCWGLLEYDPSIVAANDRAQTGSHCHHLVGGRLAPLPQMPGYGASKAALLSYGMSLRAGLRALG